MSSHIYILVKLLTKSLVGHPKCLLLNSRLFRNSISSETCPVIYLSTKAFPFDPKINSLLPFFIVFVLYKEGPLLR